MASMARTNRVVDRSDAAHAGGTSLIFSRELVEGATLKEWHDAVSIGMF